jgi:hypothetical protein
MKEGALDKPQIVLFKDHHLDTFQNYLVHRTLIRNDRLKNINPLHIWKD